MKQELRDLYFGMSLPKRLLRFAGVGAFSSLAYVLAVALYVEVLALNPTWSSALGYATIIPLNFFGHRKVTFHSNGHPARQFFRFIVMHGVNLLVCVGGMYWVVDLSGYSFWFGSLLAVVLVPLSTYVVMDLWVFSKSR